MKNQQGSAQVLATLILLGGLIVAVALIGQKTFFTPKASELKLPYTVGGQVVEAFGTSIPVPGMRVEIYDNNLNDKRIVVTDQQGTYKIDNFVRTGDAYAVRVLEHESEDYYTPVIRTITEGWTWRFNDNLDTPKFSTSYEFQRAGSNDCAGPNYQTKQTLRCNFEIVSQIRCSTPPCSRVTPTRAPSSGTNPRQYSTPTGLEVFSNVYQSNNCSITARWDRVAEVGTYRIYLNRIDDDRAGEWLPYDGNPPADYTGDRVISKNNEILPEGDSIQRSEIRVECNKNYHLALVADGTTKLPSDKSDGMVFAYGHPTSDMNSTSATLTDRKSLIGEKIVTGSVGQRLNFIGNGQSIDQFLDRAEMWVTEEGDLASNDGKYAPDCGQNAKKSGRWCNITSKSASGQIKKDSIEGSWTPSKPGNYLVTVNWFDKGPRGDNRGQCSGNPLLSYPAFGFSNCGPKSFMQVNVADAK